MRQDRAKRRSPPATPAPPRAQFSPLQNLPLINEDVANFTMEGKILLDDLADVDAGDARYYRQTLITAQ